MVSAHVVVSVANHGLGKYRSCVTPQLVRAHIPDRDKKLPPVRRLQYGGLTGGAIPPSQQPIFRPKQDRSNMYCPDSSKAAIAAAAASLAALWQVSKRP